ncbi:MAG: hypothetical protein ABFD89_19350, partial [Bryobacteraceae bacterium]
EYLDGAKWIDIAPEGMEITAFHYLEKTVKDDTGKVIGTELNEFQFKAFKESLEWDGRDLAFLQTGPFPVVQITCENEEYQGKTRLKVKWLNHRDSDGGGLEVQKSEPAGLKSLQNRLGSKLRAMAGPQKATPPKPRPPVAAAKTPEDAWTAICEAGSAAGLDEAACAEAWSAACTAICADPTAPTAAECSRIIAEAADYCKPAAAVPAGKTTDDLPF